MTPTHFSVLPLSVAKDEHMFCIYTANLHGRASSADLSVLSMCLVFRIIITRVNARKTRVFQKSYLRKVTFVANHEIYQTSKVVSQELRSSGHKCSFQYF